jgi:hypothetical protein
MNVKLNSSAINDKTKKFSELKVGEIFCSKAEYDFFRKSLEKNDRVATRHVFVKTDPVTISVDDGDDTESKNCIDLDDWILYEFSPNDIVRPIAHELVLSAD